MSGAAEELARVLIEAGEVRLAVDWIEGEARAAYYAACEVLAAPDADPDERRRAQLVRDRLGEMFAELSAQRDEELPTT